MPSETDERQVVLLTLSRQNAPPLDPLSRGQIVGTVHSEIEDLDRADYSSLLAHGSHRSLGG